MKNITLKKGPLTSDIESNLLFVRKETDNECIVTFEKESCKFIYDNQKYLQGHCNK